MRLSLLALYLTVCSDDNCRTARSYHQHRTVLSDSLVVHVNTHNGISSHLLSALHHLSHGNILCFDEHFLVLSAAAAEEISQAGHEILDDVGTDNGFASDYTFVFFYGVTLKGRSGCDYHNCQ